VNIYKYLVGAWKALYEHVRKRKNLFKLLWNAAERHGEDVVEEKLKELMK